MKQIDTKLSKMLEESLYVHKELKDDIKNHLQKILQQDTKKKEILNILILQNIIQTVK